MELDWTGKTTLVTGGHGFLGRVVCKKLEERGADEVFVPTREDYDLTDEAACAKLYADVDPDIVLHLAAEGGGIGANHANPGRYFYANTAMGLHMIEQGRRHGIEKFVQIGSISAYPKHTPVPFREEELWGGYPEETNAPYGIAKKALLVMLQAYRAQYGFPGIYLLPVTLYGPNDNFDLETSHVIPALIRRIVAARDADAQFVDAWGTGQASREFLHVNDCAEGILLAAERYDHAAPVNLGTDHEVTIEDLAEKIATLVGFGGRIRWDKTRPDGQPRRRLNTERAAVEFGFRAATRLEDGLRQTIEWWEAQQPATVE